MIQRRTAVKPSLGDPYSVFAACYGTAVHTRALAGCVLRQYFDASTLVSALFNDGVCIALTCADADALRACADDATLDRNERGRQRAITQLIRGRSGWMLAARACPSQSLDALDAAARDADAPDSAGASLPPTVGAAR